MASSPVISTRLRCARRALHCTAALVWVQIVNLPRLKVSRFDGLIFTDLKGDDDRGPFESKARGTFTCRAFRSKVGRVSCP
jgi:hypothetical protein